MIVRDGHSLQPGGGPEESVDMSSPTITPKPDGEVPSDPRLHWCVFVGKWCKGSDCYCELTLFA